MFRTPSPETRARQRRGVLALAAALACAALLPGPGRAVDGSAPETLVLTLSNEVISSIRGDKAIQAGDFERVQKLVNEKIMPHVDFDKMTRLAVGRAWRGATPDQRTALIDQFRSLLMRTYSGALSKVTDHTVKLKPSRVGQDSPTDVIVHTLVVPSQGEAIGLDYRLEKTDADWKIYDLNIQGVWLVENYKSEFATTLNQSGVDGLIQALRDKNQKLAAGKAP